MVKFVGAKSHTGTLWLWWLLATCGFGILLGGVASVQQACGGNPQQAQTFAGASGYFGPVACDKIFRYTWWTTFYFFFVWALVLGALAGGFLHKFRAGLVGLLAVAIMLLMDTANSFLYINDVNGLSGTFATRARVVVAGAIISAVASFLLLISIGIHDETSGWEQETGTKGPRGAATTTTTAAPAGTEAYAPGTVPVSTSTAV